MLKVAGRAEAGGVVVRCDTRLHPRKRAAPLQFAFYKYSRAVRRFDWGAEYTVPAPEVDELESHWCEAATASRSVRKRSAWLQLRGPGECPRAALPALGAPSGLARPRRPCGDGGTTPPAARPGVRRFAHRHPQPAGRSLGSRKQAAFLPKAPGVHVGPVGHFHP